MTNASAKKRANGHRSRKGTNGKPTTAKHNDREFDVRGAEHIDESLLQDNIYWRFIDLHKAFPDAAIPKVASFDEYEQQIYEIFFGRALELRNDIQITARHKNRVQTMEQFRKNAKACPEEIIRTIGNRDDRISAEQLKGCYLDFYQWHKQTFPNFLLLDAALHADEPEAAIHIHERGVWYYKDKDANDKEYLAVGQAKALEQMGIDRPEPDKKESRYNNAKVTYTAIVREKWLDIAEAHGIVIERTPQDKEKSGLPLWKLKAQTLKKEIAELECTVAYLDSEIEEKKDVLSLLHQAETDLAKKQVELDEVTIQIDRKKIELTKIPPRPSIPPEPFDPKKSIMSKGQRDYKAAKKKYEQQTREVQAQQAEWDGKWSVAADVKGIAERQQHEQVKLNEQKRRTSEASRKTSKEAAALATEKTAFETYRSVETKRLKRVAASLEVDAQQKVQQLLVQQSPKVVFARQRDEDNYYISRHKADYSDDFQAKQNLFQKVKYQKRGGIER